MALPKRIGLLVPSTNTVAEPSFHMAVPEGVTVHSHRLWHDFNPDKPAVMDRMNSELAQASRYLASARIDVVCMAGTTNSFYKGMDGSRWMEEEMGRMAGVPAVASSPSIVQALRRYGVKRISVATPYVQFANQRLREYFTAAGFDVLNVSPDPQVHPHHINDQEPERILEFATSVCREEADALFCPCSAWRAMEVAAELERRLNKLVITTNQATLWRTLKKIGVDTAKPGFGRLLDEMPAIEDPVGAS